jgi:hypothetical protein
MQAIITPLSRHNPLTFFFALSPKAARRVSQRDETNSMLSQYQTNGQYSAQKVGAIQDFLVRFGIHF